MESVGSYLRDLRIARGLSLEEVARATRVASYYLEALEGEYWTRLPAPAFTKGFIRAYCQMLGEPPDEALSRYGAALREVSPPAAASPGPPATGKLSRRPVLVSLALLVTFGLGLFLVSLGFREARAPEPKAAPPAPSVSPPTVSATPSPPAEAPAETPARSRLVAHATEPTWVRVQLSDAQVVEELLPAGATREWLSDQRFVLTVGNAGGLSLELNGRPLPPLGARGEVIRQLVLPQDAKVTTP